MSKNISIQYKDTKINVIDTPGHADFGGESRSAIPSTWPMALLIVDAYEGPKPQTRFVLSHALELGLRIVVVVNKIDRPNADTGCGRQGVRPHGGTLGATDEQLDFPVVYASAVNGYARFEPEDGNMDMIPLLDTILKEIPAPRWRLRRRWPCRSAPSTTAATRAVSASVVFIAASCTKKELVLVKRPMAANTTPRSARSIPSKISEGRSLRGAGRRYHRGHWH